jgi:hypothetical protein
MHVFISWSGEFGKSLAEALREWLPTMLQDVEPYFTPSDIEKGARWENEISKKLEQSKFCMIALTRDSLNSNWIMFEAGAISRSVDKARICTILFGIEATDLPGPLASFQSTKFTREDVYKLVETINKNLDKPIHQIALDKTFNKMWPDLEEAVSKIMSGAGSLPKQPARDQRDLLEEVLGLSRLMAGKQSDALDRLIKLLEASIRQNRNPLFNTTVPATLAELSGFTSDPPSSTPGSTTLGIIDWLRQADAPPSAGTASVQMTSIPKSE